MSNAPARQSRCIPTLKPQTCLQALTTDLTPDQLVQKYHKKQDSDDREEAQRNLELNQLMRLAGMLEKDKGEKDEGIGMDVTEADETKQSTP